MPVVLVTAAGEPSSGYTYNDVTGVSYEYPTMYRKLIQTGEPFVYNIARVGYTGSGVIGDIRNSENEGRLVCKILDYKPFQTPVSIRDPDGVYFEPNNDPDQSKVYWARGVRPISIRGYEQIVGSSPPEPSTESVLVSGYASKEVAVLVESISVRAAEEWLRSNFPGELIAIMPHSNPGYDIRVGPHTSPVAFIEVKGTQSTFPVFWLSEGERKFSIANSDKYVFIVVSGIDLKSESNVRLTVRRGALSGNDVSLDPSQWRGRLLREESAAP